MKNINLLPPDLRITRFGSNFPAKRFIGCLVIPGALLLLAFGVFKFYRYRYQPQLGEPVNLASNKPPEPAAPIKPSPSDQANAVSVTEPKSLSSTVKSAGTVEQAQALKQAKPVGESTPLQSATPIASIPIEPESAGGYILRFGLFIDTGKAETAAKTLQKRGIKVFQQLKQEERDVFTVFMDGYTTYEEGMIQARRLEKDHFPATVEFHEQGVRVKIEGFLAHSNAKEMADRLKTVGYTPKITKEFIPLTIYEIRSAPFPTYREAKETQLSLERAGFNSVIVFKGKQG